MVFVLRKSWILFVVAVILAPCLVEAFDLVGREMFPESMNRISVFRELLGKESCEFKEVFMVTVVCNPLFGWLKYGNQLFASLGSKVRIGTMSVVSNLTDVEQRTANNSDDCGYNWWVQFVFYLFLFGSVAWVLIDFIL